MLDSISHPIDFLDSGDSVSAVQAALMAEGLDISEEEARLKVFGRSSRDALTRMQGQLGLQVTGRVDGPTARALNAHLDARGVLRESRAILHDIRRLRRTADAGDLTVEADRILGRIADAELNRLVLSQVPKASDEMRDAVELLYQGEVRDLGDSARP